MTAFALPHAIHLHVLHCDCWISHKHFTSSTSYSNFLYVYCTVVHTCNRQDWLNRMLSLLSSFNLPACLSSFSSSFQASDMSTDIAPMQRGTAICTRARRGLCRDDACKLLKTSLVKVQQTCNISASVEELIRVWNRCHIK